jgi:hypothetical protein
MSEIKTPTQGISKVWNFFKGAVPNLTAFKKEWGELSEDDKAQIREGIENGTLTY